MNTAPEITTPLAPSSTNAPEGITPGARPPVPAKFQEGLANANLDPAQASPYQLPGEQLPNAQVIPGAQVAGYSTEANPASSAVPAAFHEGLAGVNLDPTQAAIAPGTEPAIAATTTPPVEAAAYTPSPIVTETQPIPSIATSPAPTTENPYAINGAPVQPDLSGLPSTAPAAPVAFAQMGPEAAVSPAPVDASAQATFTTEATQPVIAPTETITPGVRPAVPAAFETGLAGVNLDPTTPAPAAESAIPTPPPTESNAQQPDILANTVETSGDQAVMKIMADATVALGLARGTDLDPEQKEKLENGVVEAVTRRLTHEWGVPVPGVEPQSTTTPNSSKP